MSDQNYTTSISVDQSPEEVFSAINNVHRCTFKITEFVPGRKVVWQVLDNYFNFTRDKSEWKGTDSLHDLIATGKGQPNPIEEIVARARQMGREAGSKQGKGTW
jgi:hypothetical protein